MRLRSTQGIGAYVSELCACSSHGGRVVQIDADRYMVQDVPSWTDGMTQCVKNRYPLVEVSVYESKDSLSGFNIVLRVDRQPHFLAESRALFAVAALAVAAAAWLLFGQSPF